MAGGAAPPMTPRQRAFLQSVHDARLAQRKAALEKNLAARREKERLAVEAEVARNQALAEAAEAEELKKSSLSMEEAKKLKVAQRALQAQFEATRPRTLAELVEASMKDEP